MKANQSAVRCRRGDDAVSPVIAVILMVAITVVLAATVYVWVSGLSTQESGPERVTIRPTAGDFDGDASNDWITLTMTEGANAPYDFSVITIRVIHNGAVKTSTATSVSNSTQFLLCESPSRSGLDCASAWASGDSRDTGESLYIACQDASRHKLSVEIRGSTVLDNFDVTCDEAA